MTKWTKEDKEWLGYRRKMSVQNKDKITLPEVSVSLSKENKWTKD